MDCDDILVLGKNNGTVRRAINGEMSGAPLLDVNVANQEEQGMLGMAIEKRNLVKSMRRPYSSSFTRKQPRKMVRKL